jgi:hypothetical protein
MSLKLKVDLKYFLDIDISFKESPVVGCMNTIEFSDFVKGKQFFDWLSK